MRAVRYLVATKVLASNGLVISIHRAIWAARCYYRRWFWKACSRSYAIAAGPAGAIGLFGPPISQALHIKDADRIMSMLIW